jgi:hypothetical protein
LTLPPPQQRLEGLWHHRSRLRHSNGLRGSDIIDPASTIATARRALTSSTPPPPQQRLEELQHHRPCLHHSNDSRGSGIINPASTTAMARGAPTSLTPPPPLPPASTILPLLHQRLEKLRHYIQYHRLLHHELDIIIHSFNHVPRFPHKHQPISAGGRTREKRLEVVSQTFDHSSYNHTTEDL